VLFFCFLTAQPLLYRLRPALAALQAPALVARPGAILVRPCGAEYIAPVRKSC
jgi:hypothetical protein